MNRYNLTYIPHEEELQEEVNEVLDGCRDIMPGLFVRDEKAVPLIIRAAEETTMHLMDEAYKVDYAWVGKFPFNQQPYLFGVITISEHQNTDDHIVLIVYTKWTNEPWYDTLDVGFQIRYGANLGVDEPRDSLRRYKTYCWGLEQKLGKDSGELGGALGL